MNAGGKSTLPCHDVLTEHPSLNRYIVDSSEVARLDRLALTIRSTFPVWCGLFGMNFSGTERVRRRLRILARIPAYFAQGPAR